MYKPLAKHTSIKCLSTGFNVSRVIPCNNCHLHISLNPPCFQVVRFQFVIALMASAQHIKRQPKDKYSPPLGRRSYDSHYKMGVQDEIYNQTKFASGTMLFFTVLTPHV